ncbi:MAG: thermopsin family protease [Thermoplasmata archaeon]|nr:thermopsin family protease [Thermoplasmata archaeon]
MTRWWQAAGILVVAIAAVMLLPAFSVGLGGAAVTLPNAHPAGTTATAARSATTADSALVAKALAAGKADNIPTSSIFVPNVNSAPTASNGVVQPGYVATPAPMGLGYFGIQKVGGVNVGSISYYPSVEAAVTLNSVDPLYLASSSPDIFTMQLNTVATHVDVLGNTTGTFWIQNVPVYTASTQTLNIEDNIWNFSSPGAGMQVHTLHSYDGNLVPGVFYYAVGPSWHVPTPFTIQLYNNLTIQNLRPTMFFNYSVTTSNGSRFWGSYDQVEFNSAVHPTTAAPRPTFQINGQQTNAFGLLNDAEIMIGGPGGGSTTTFFNINATMGLWTRANGSSTYTAVPAGYDFGTDTGETSEGIAEWTPGPSNPVAELGSGPGLLQPLWGLVGAQSGFIRETITVSPSNAFVFANQGGTWNENTAGWAPVPASGVATYDLSPHTYSFDFLLSDHNSATVTLSSTTTLSVSLGLNTSTGVYTPLWAWNNGQLAAISSGGTGTMHNPYVLDNNAVGPVSALFGEFNDYYYPVFSGIFLSGTTAYVSATGLSDFNVAYTLPVEAAFSGHFETPFSNNLGLQFYNDTHVSLVNNAQITGWTFSQDPYISSVLFWGSSDSLVAGNSFQVQSIGIMTFGGTNNVISGNVFTAATTTAADPGQVLYSTSQQALQVYESGDLIYNNAFLTPVTAVAPPFNLYTGAFQPWTDRWNVTPQSATHGRIVNGWNLSGSIVGGAIEAGNYWANYGTPSNPYGVVPYTDSGGIFLGGDYKPLTLAPLHRIVFTESGLPAATPWSVTIDGYTQSSSTTTITFLETNGLYAFSVGAVSGYTASPKLGAVNLHGTLASVAVTWT